MLQALKESIFFLIPIIAPLMLSVVLFYLYFKEKNVRKLVFAISLFLSAFGFYNPFLDSIGQIPLFSSGDWLFVPMSLAVIVAALSTFFKITNFRVPFIFFIFGTLLSLVAFFIQFSFTILSVGLMLIFMIAAIPLLIFTFLKSRDSTDLNFLLAVLCFLFQGLVMNLGTSVEIPVMLSLFGVISFFFMFNQPGTVNPSNISSFIILEKKLYEANQKIRKLEEKLVESEKLAAIGELAGIIGHDLRNPLQGIVGATHYLKTHSNQTKNYKVCKEMLNEIDDCIKRSDKIINDLIQYSQIINLQTTSIDPKKLISNSLNQIMLPVNIDISDQTNNHPSLIVDNTLIERAFLSLIKNAFDSMPNGGKLDIKSKKSRNTVVFIFQDTGEGMSEQTLKNLWKPLFTTKAKGMGFGLPICKRFIDAHGGKILVKSQLGRGTTFKIILPINSASKDLSN